MSLAKQHAQNIRRLADDLTRSAELARAHIQLVTPIDKGNLRSQWVAGPKAGPQDVTKAPNPGGVDSLTHEGGHLKNDLIYAPVIDDGLYPGDGPKTRGGFSTQALRGVTKENLPRIKSFFDEALL